MGTCYTVIVLDDAWGRYIDGYDAHRAWHDLQAHIPHATLVGLKQDMLIVEIGKTLPEEVHRAVRCDVLYYQEDMNSLVLSPLWPIVEVSTC